MSGPIVRRYGFPNFEQIFGKREPAHGVDTPPDAAEKAEATQPPKADGAAKQPEDNPQKS